MFKLAIAALLIGTPLILAPMVQAQPREDEPGWDCATMGNRVCGDPIEWLLGTPPVPVSTPGSWVDLMLPPV